MASTADFSSNGIEVISREVHINATKTPLPASGDFLEFYEIDRTIKCIQEGDYKRVCPYFSGLSIFIYSNNCPDRLPYNSQTNCYMILFLYTTYYSIN